MEGLHIFITHYTPLKKRKEFILNELKTKIGNIKVKELACEFDKNEPEYTLDSLDPEKPIHNVYIIRKYDRDYMTSEIKDILLCKVGHAAPLEQNIRLEYTRTPNYNENIVTKDNFKTIHNHSLFKHRKSAEESLALKHYEAYRLILEMELKLAIVIEDDCSITENFVKKFNDYLNYFPENGICTI